MPNPIPKHRLAAHTHQQGRCYYCDLPMWLESPEELAVRYSLKPSALSGLRCTAEHLTARQDGGGNTRENIVAACLTCNSRRHRSAKPLGPRKHRKKVRARLQVGKWHPQALKKLVASARPGCRE